MDGCRIAGAAAASSRASEILKALISQGILRGGVIEYLGGRGQKPSPVAFGLTGFLSNAFAQQYVASPYPHLEIALLEQARSSDGKGRFLDHDEVAQANSGQGLTAFPLLWFQRATDPALAETRLLLQAGQQSFLRIHRGYRLHGILKEAPADRIQAFVDGGFREDARIASGTPFGFSPRKLEREHVVLGASRADAERTMPGTMISHLFVYQAPRCGFTQFERQCLSAPLITGRTMRSHQSWV